LITEAKEKFSVL